MSGDINFFSLLITEDFELPFFRPVTGITTEDGVYKPEELLKKYK